MYSLIFKVRSSHCCPFPSTSFQSELTPTCTIPQKKTHKHAHTPVCPHICSVHSSVETFFLSSRPIYVSTVRPQSKHIVVILDHGASVTDTQLQIAKDAAQVILSAIDEHDKVTVIPVTLGA